MPVLEFVLGRPEETVSSLDRYRGLNRWLEAVRLVRPGGAAYLTTRHGRSLSARVLRTRWRVVAPPEHLQLFSIAGMRAAPQRAGLTIRSVATHGVNPHELAAGLRSGRAQTPCEPGTVAKRRHNERWQAGARA